MAGLLSANSKIFIRPFWQMAFTVATIHLLLTCSFGQRLSVRTEKAPHYAGEPIAIEVDAIDFSSQPEIEIEGADKEGIDLEFRNSGRSESTQIFQSGGKLVRRSTVKTTFYYQVIFEAAGEYQIGPFTTEEQGKQISYPAIRFSVEDVEVSNDMKVEIVLPEGNLYPGQRVPIELRWLFAGDPRQIRGLTIRNPLFDRYRFFDETPSQASNTLPLTTAKGIQNLPAEFERKTVDGREFLVGTVKRTMIPDKPEAVTLPPTFVSFQLIVGTTRSDDIFDSFFDVRTKTVPMKGVGSATKFEVKPFPDENRPPSFDGAVGQGYEISTSLNRTSFRTGDPLILQVNIEGKGNLESIGLPDLAGAFRQSEFDWPQGEVAGVANGDQKQFRIPLRIKDEKVKEIPPLEFSWFDPQREEYQTVSSTPIAIDVKAGDVVSSEDVFTNEGPAAKDAGNNADDDGVQIDLSIETDHERLIGKDNQPKFLAWTFYAVGLGGLGIFWAFERARKKPSEGQAQKRSLEKCCQQIRRMGVTADLCKTLAAHLRELQGLLVHGTKAQMQKLAELDDLIARCDAVAFRPEPPNVEEQQELLELAYQFVEGLQAP